MDSFAENQMGRDDPPPTPDISRRAQRNSKERYGIPKSRSKDGYDVKSPPLMVAGSEQQLLAVDNDGAENVTPGKEQTKPTEDGADKVDVPCMSLEASALIASRWERKKANFMPVGDPYDEPDNSTPFHVQLARTYCTMLSCCGVLKRLTVRLFPVLEWAPRINTATLRADVIAGLTVGVMLIPQSMSYADIAGLQYKYGMYTSVLPLITYALMGTSRQLGVGPVAMVSLLVEVGLKGALSEEQCPEYYAQKNSTLPEADWELQATLCPDEYARLAFLTSFLVGLFQIGAGVLNLGFLVSFLAHPVVSGFTSAAAIIIGLSQIQYFLGYKIPKSQFVYETVGHVFDKIDQTQWEQLVLGLSWWFMLWFSRRLATKQKKRFGWLRPSAPLITCVLAIIVGSNLEIFNGCGFQKCTNASNPYIVGKIPSGVTEMGSANLLDFGQISTVFSTAVSCSVIGYMESIAISKSLAAKHKYVVDAGQELIALGTANLLGSVTSSYPVTGSFSRSAVNNQVGAQTQLAGMITGLLLLVTLLLLTPLFYFLPKYALAAIVIASVTNLVDYNEAIHLWKVKKQDCFLWVIAFLGTLFLGVQVGLLGAIIVSLMLVIVESVRPQMTVLWRLPGTPIYRSIKQESAGLFVPGVIVVRIGASMYFANVAFIRDYITKMVEEFSEAADTSQRVPATPNCRKACEDPATRTTSSTVSASAVSADGSPASVPLDGTWASAEPIKYIVMEMTPVMSVDSTAMHMLEDMHRDLKERGIRLAFSTVGKSVEDALTRSGLIDKMGEQWIHPSVHSAVTHCMRHRIKASQEVATESATTDAV